MSNFHYLGANMGSGCCGCPVADDCCPEEPKPKTEDADKEEKEDKKD